MMSMRWVHMYTERVPPHDLCRTILKLAIGKLRLWLYPFLFLEFSILWLFLLVTPFESFDALV